MRSDTLIGVYAGSFDPVTNGHLDVIKRGVALFDKIIVAVGVHPSRSPLFTLEERLTLLRESTSSLPNVSADSFEGLLIHYCERVEARVVIRGLRHTMDFEYELQIAQANTDMAPEVETIFLPTSLEWGFVTASLVREIASHGGDVSRYVPPAVAKALKLKFS